MEKENQFQQLWDDGKNLLESHYELLRMEMLEKSASLINLLLVVLLAVLFLFVALVFAAIALTHLIGELIGSMALAYLIMGGVFLLCFLYLVIFRRGLFVRSLSKPITQILFPDTGKAPNREMVELERKHRLELVQRDFEVIRAHLIGVQLFGNLLKKAVSYLEDRLFDGDEEDDLYSEIPEEEIHARVEGEESES